MLNEQCPYYKGLVYEMAAFSLCCIKEFSAGLFSFLVRLNRCCLLKLFIAKALVLPISFHVETEKYQHTVDYVCSPHPFPHLEKEHTFLKKHYFTVVLNNVCFLNLTKDLVTRCSGFIPNSFTLFLTHSPYLHKAEEMQLHRPKCIR